MYIEELNEQVKNHFKESMAASPLTRFFPIVESSENLIQVEWLEHVVKTNALVEGSTTNTIALFPTSRQVAFVPAYFRRGAWLKPKVTSKESESTGASLVKPGMPNLLSSRGEGFKDLCDMAAFLFTILSAQMLLGGISYTDPESNVKVTAESGIPDSNKLTYSGLWDLHNTISSLPYRKNIPGTWTYICNSSIETALSSLMPVTYGDAPKPEIVAISTLYDSVKDGVATRGYLWPNDKIVAIFTPDLFTTALGKTYLTKGEHPRGKEGYSGIWYRHIEPVKTFADCLGPKTLTSETMTEEQKADFASKYFHEGAYQIGVAGLPVITHPERVFIISPSSC